MTLDTIEEKCGTDARPLVIENIMKITIKAHIFAFVQLSQILTELSTIC